MSYSHTQRQPHACHFTCKGTRIVQADTGSDSDSESRNKNEEIIPVNCLTQTVCTNPPEPATTIEQRTFFAPSGAKNVLCLTVQMRIVVAGSGGSVQTVWVRRFTGMISSFLFRLSESESEPESACTIRVPLRYLSDATYIQDLQNNLADKWAMWTASRMRWVSTATARRRNLSQ